MPGTRRRRVQRCVWSFEQTAYAEEDVFSFAASKSKIDARDGVARPHEIHAEPVVSLQVLEVQFGTPGDRLAGIEEDRRIDRTPHIPAVFRLEQQHVVVAE